MFDTVASRGMALAWAIEHGLSTLHIRSDSELLVKQMTGGDVMSARFMKAEWFDFAPTHKLWLSTNHKPEIRGTDGRSTRAGTFRARYRKR